MMIGYLPASLGHGAGVSCQKVLVEAGCEQIVQGRSAAVGDCTKPELQGLLHRLQQGDFLLAPPLSSLGDSLAEVAQFVQSLKMSGIGLRSLGDAQDCLLLPLAGQVTRAGSQAAPDGAAAQAVPRGPS